MKLPETLEEAHDVIARLVERIEELERRLNQSSRNSSRPPSSDPPSLKLPPKPTPTGRKPGGQPGHKGNRRELLPIEEVDKVEHHWPRMCDGCDKELPKVLRTDIGEPMRHQVTELPKIKGEVTEHVMHTQHCPRCDNATECPWPEGVPRSAFGPKLAAVAGLLTGCFRMSKRSTVDLLQDMFGIKVSLGSISAAEQTVSESLAAPVDKARYFVQSQTVANLDETSWVEGRRKAWLWVMATAFVTVFLIHRARGAIAGRKLWGSFRGVLCSDRWAVYREYRNARQVCWSHLARDFQALSEYEGETGRHGRRLVKKTKEIFRLWHQARDGTISRRTFRMRMKPIRHTVEKLLALVVTSGAAQASGMCWDIAHEHGDALWIFVDIEGVEPTNNRAEQALRHAVLWRKSSFGTHSEAGSRFVERMLTVRASLRSQGRNIVQYVTDAVEAALHRAAPPSLLPQLRQQATAQAA